MTWLWVRNRYPKWKPGKWERGLKPAVPWWFSFDPCPPFDLLLAPQGVTWRTLHPADVWSSPRSVSAALPGPGPLPWDGHLRRETSRGRRRPVGVKRKPKGNTPGDKDQGPWKCLNGLVLEDQVCESSLTQNWQLFNMVRSNETSAGREFASTVGREARKTTSNS